MDSFHSILNELLKNIPETIPELFNNNSALKIKEFRTVGFTSTRQTGKTEFAKELLKEDENSVMLVTNSNEKDFIISNDSSVDSKRLYTVREFVADKDILVPISRVIIDESYHCYRSVGKNKVFNKIADLSSEAIVIEIN